MGDFFKGTSSVEVTGPGVAFSFDIFGVKINVTETIVVGWIVMLIITGLILFLTHNMQKVPTKKRQVIAEMLVTTVNNLVNDTMGKKFKNFAPYIATIFSFSIFGSLISLFGLRSVTADFNTTFCWALMTFIMIEYNKIKADGILGYFKGFLSPVFFMLPLNIVSELSTPVSMGFRHFGNVAGGMIITNLLYFSLTGVSHAIGLAFPIFTIGVPAVLSVYFDLFSGFMQAFIFIMLTMIYIANAAGVEEET